MQEQGSGVSGGNAPGLFREAGRRRSVHGPGVGLHPLPDAFQPVEGCSGKGAVRLGADVHKEVRTFGGSPY